MSTSSPVRERRDIKALEERRKKAGHLFARGIAHAEVARRFRVSRPAVHYWYLAWAKHGTQGLASKRGKFGRLPRMTDAHVARVKNAILKGPRHAGFPTDMWTLGRIASVIKKTVSISYHPSHVWKVLHAMGFTCQIPDTRSKERNEKAIKAWRAMTWPALQKRGPLKAGA